MRTTILRHPVGLLIALSLLLPPLQAAPLSGSAPAAPSGQEEGKTVARVRVAGAIRVPESTIREYIRTAAGQPYDASAVRADFDRLLATGLFIDVKVQVVPLDQRQVEIVFEVTEPLFVQDISFTGVKEAILEELKEHLRNSNLTIHPGSALDEGRLTRLEREVRLFMEAKGFPLARIEVERTPKPTHAISITVRINEGPKARIGSIDFEGNHLFSDRELRDALQLTRTTSFLTHIRQRDRYIEEYLDFDIRNNVLPLYQARGYIFARAETPKVTLVETKNKEALRYQITIPLVEGEQYRYREFRVEGADKIDPERVKQAYQIRPGEIVDFPALNRSNEAVKRLYAERGFLDMRLEPQVRANHDNHTVGATIRIEEGERYLVRKIDFQGNERTRDKVLRREFRIDEQDPFDIRLLEQSIARLNQLGFLEPITDRDYELRKNPATTEVDILVRVKETDEHAINFEGGAWGISGSYAGINYQSRNFRGLGQLLELQLSPGTRTSVYALTWTDPYWLDTRLMLSLSAYHRQLVYDTFAVLPDDSTERLDLFNQRSTGFEATTSYPLGKWSRVGVAYSLDSSRISSDDPGFRSYALSQLALFTDGGRLTDIRRSQVAPFWVYNTRNQPFGATRGSYFFARLPVAGGPFGGHIKIAHPFIEYRKYFPDGLTGGRNTWAFRVRAQHVLGYGRLSNGMPSPVPFIERIYLGGEQDLRGFDLRTVGPYAIHRIPQVDPEGNPILDPVTGEPVFDEKRVAIGGDTAGAFTAEYRIPVYGPIQVTPFLDVGTSSVFRKRDLRVSGTGTQAELIASTNCRWRMSTGAELQFLLPVVNQPFRLIFAANPLRLDTRARVGSQEELIREPKTNITFSIGYSF